MDKDADNDKDEHTDSPKGDTKYVACCVSVVVLISRHLQIVGTRTGATKTMPAVMTMMTTTTGMARRTTPQSYFVSPGK
jgi:hypothetical protein